MSISNKSRFLISRTAKTDAARKRQEAKYDPDAVNRRRRIEELQERHAFNRQYEL